MPKKVMIVDDAKYMREMIKDILLIAGYSIAGEVDDGVMAIEKYPIIKPDLVTMDIVMRNKSGIDTVKELMKIDPNAKILMISAIGQQSIIIDSIQAGAKGFISKPFKPEILIEEVKRLIGE